MIATRNPIIRRTMLASALTVSMLIGAAACGGSSEESSPNAEEQALVDLLVDAARRGADEEFASIVAQADPDLITQVLPEVEDALGIDISGDNSPTNGAQTDQSVAGSDDEGSDAPNSTAAGSAEGDLSPTSTNAPSNSLPKITVPGPSSLPPANLPTTNAPSISLPKITVPGPSTLPATNLPTPATIENVELLTVRGELQVEVLVSGGIWDTATKTRSPESVYVRYRTGDGIIRSIYLTRTGQLGSSTSIWSENVLADADPCSFEIAVSPSTTLQRFRLSDSC